MQAHASPTASTTDQTLGIAAVAGKRVRVTGFLLSTTAATAITFNSKGSGSGTACSVAFTVNGNFAAPENSNGWFDTNAGETLTVSTGTGSTAGVHVTYEHI